MSSKGPIAIHGRQTMTTLVARQTPIFDQSTRTFGSESGVAVMDKMERMEIQLAEIRPQREEDRRSLDYHGLLLDQLKPARLRPEKLRGSISAGSSPRLMSPNPSAFSINQVCQMSNNSMQKGIIWSLHVEKWPGTKAMGSILGFQGESLSISP